MEDHQKECYLRPVGLVLMEGGEELAVPYKDLPSVVRQRVLAQAKEGTDISIRVCSI